MAEIAKIPRVQTTDRNINQLQSNIIPRVNTLLSNPLVNGNILSDVALVTGNNTINHLLGRVLTGWIIILQSASAIIYDQQSGNTEPELTLKLSSSADVTVSIYVF